MDIVDLLLAKGADVNEKDEDVSVLSCECQQASTTNCKCTVMVFQVSLILSS